MKIFILFISFILFIQCQKTIDSDNSIAPFPFSNTEAGYAAGDYCAEVKYYNPNTGTHSSYTLTVEVSDNKVVQINFPNGGYFDNEITDGNLDSSGEASFTSNKGYKYDVKITGEAGNCFENAATVQQCRGITKKGKQCKHQTDNASGYCWQHEGQK